jgi:hypothetical protein
MPKYIVENTATEERRECRTWRAAMRAAAAMGDPDRIHVIERDRDGEREYNVEGQVLSRDGHYR